MVKLFGIVLVLSVIVLLLSLLANVLVSDRSTKEPFFGLQPFTDRVRQLADIGQVVRSHVPALASTKNRASETAQRSDARRSEVTHASDRGLQSESQSSIPLLGNVLNHEKLMKSATRLLEVYENIESSVLGTAKTRGQEKEVEAPSIKRFRGGRDGRRIESGVRR